MLTIVATPIGNLKDITLRALEALQSCDQVICEDIRITSKLLNHYQIRKPLLVLNDFNETKNIPAIMDKLKQNLHLVLVSDAGTPLISDPGFKLIRSCLEQKLPVDSLPGPSSVITALTLSGLPSDKFMFLGYLPDKPGHRQQTYQKILEINKIQSTTFIILVAPFKLVKTLTEMEQSLGDINVILAKELTKIYQSVKNSKISDWLNELKTHPPKGEYVLVFNLN